MKYSEQIYKYLEDYYFEMLNDNNLSRECDSFYDTANALHTLKKITLDENDLLCDSMYGLTKFIFKVISTCPHLQHIANLSKEELEFGIKAVKFIKKGD